MSILSTQLAGEREKKSHQCGMQRETGYGGSQLYGLEDKQQKSQKKNC